MKRRSFLAASTLFAAAGVGQEANPKRRVAVIGHSGRGNYGHGLDTVWKKIPEAEIVGVADASATGLAKEQKKLGVDNGYADYRKMLTELKPEFVSVCPRHPDQHHDMTLAAIEAGVKGVYVEKPFCRTPAEADSLIATAARHGTKIAVAHRNRYHPVLKQIQMMLSDTKSEASQVGKLLEIRGRGKGDHRGGSEDLWVLGSHVLNLFQYFSGPPKTCSAVVLQDGRHVTADDVKPGNEGLGPLAGNEVHARYETEGGVIAYYDSIANDDTAGRAYCLQLIGSRGTIILHIDRDPVAHLIPGNPYDTASKARQWIPITSAGVGKLETQKELIAKVHNHVLAVRDLIDACDSDRKPMCDVLEGAAAVEMICAVFESHRQGGKAVSFPLQERGNALAKL